jgi:integrase
MRCGETPRRGGLTVTADAGLAPTSRQRLLLRTYADYFERRIAGLSPNCRARYGSQLRRHIVPALGRLPLDRIDAAIVQAFLAELLAKKMAASTACSVGRLLLRILAVADMEGRAVAAINPHRLVWPRSQTPPVEPRAFTIEEVDRILAATTGWPRVLFAVLALAGLRISEGLGLDWSHVDWQRSELQIRQQASRGKLRVLKSSTSRVDLPMHSALRAILAAYWQSEGSPVSGLLFGGAAGLPRRAEGIASRHLSPLLSRLGIPHGGCHSFRHGFCVRCWQAGLPADVIRRLMRHSSFALTLRYSHTGAAELRAGIDRLEFHAEAQS